MMVVHQPDVPNPMMLSSLFLVWATRREKMLEEVGDVLG